MHLVFEFLKEETPKTCVCFQKVFPQVSHLAFVVRDRRLR